MWRQKKVMSGCKLETERLIVTYPNFHVLFVTQFFRTYSLRNMNFTGKIDPRMNRSLNERFCEVSCTKRLCHCERNHKKMWNFVCIGVSLLKGRKSERPMMSRWHDRIVNTMCNRTEMSSYVTLVSQICRT